MKVSVRIIPEQLVVSEIGLYDFSILQNRNNIPQKAQKEHKSFYAIKT